MRRRNHGNCPPPPTEALETAQNDTNFIQLTGDEMTILRTMSGQSPKISQDEAISIADKLLGRDNSLSKSAGAVRCEVLTRPSSKISKSGTPEQDTMMYVLNYGNSDGYAVICADVRVPDQVFAYSDTGEMDTQTDNPGVQMFMDMAQDYMDFKIAEVESKRDSVESVIQEKLEEASDYQGKHLSKSRTLVSSYSYDYWRGKETKITEQRKPLLRTYWHQGPPYNNYVPICKDSSRCVNHDLHCTNRSAAGCVAIATGQLVAYWKWPATVNNVAMDWDVYMFFDDLQSEKGARNSSYYSHRVATLVSWIGENVGMDYGCAASGAFTADAVDFLSSIGYYTYDLKEFSDYAAAQSLRYGFPVMIRGNSEYDKSANEYHNGHAWLIDGFVLETTTHLIKNMIVNTYRESNGTTSYEVFYSSYYGDDTESYYFHCNWGWGDDNGYYLSNMFKCQNYYNVNSATNTMSSVYNSRMSNYYYKYNIEIACNIHR